MATENKTGTASKNEPPAGAQPAHKSEKEDEKRRDVGKSESSGDAPMDPADEKFIDSK
jgi:hypothetical protein